MPSDTGLQLAEQLPSRDHARTRLRLGSISVDAITFDEALDAIEDLVARRRGGVVVTPNVDHVVIAERRPDFREVYAAADLSLADGQPIVWSSRLLGTRLPEKISGSDLVLPLMNRAARRGWRVFLLGAGPGVAERAARRLHGERAVRIVGTAAPIISAEPGHGTVEEHAAIAAIRAANADLVLVAFGAPKQELWMERHRRELAPAVLLGVGASLDFVAGAARRAPNWVSRIGLEWLWRLCREPRRLWRRYLVDDLLFIAVLWRAIRDRRRVPP
jgi:N-acetylglucosaminyldiphosphoundecaprenol N-acetyl-beta-D-mannosaminyltransferase